MSEGSRQYSVQRHTMLHPFLMAALLVLLLASNVGGSISSQIWPVVVAAAAGIICIIECRLAGLSWAHPRIFIMGYVTLACSSPPIYLYLRPDSAFAQFFQGTFLHTLSPQISLLMAFTILATGVGLSLQSYRPRRAGAPPESDFELDHDPSTIMRHRIGRVVLIFTSLPIFVQGLATGDTLRGFSGPVVQLSWAVGYLPQVRPDRSELYDVPSQALTSFVQFALMAAVVVVYSSRLQLRWSLGKATLDHVMVALAIVGYLLSGSRHVVLALVLILLILRQSSKETRLRNLALLGIAAATLFYWTASYRSGDPGLVAPFALGDVGNSFVTDLSSVAGTTAVVRALVPATHPLTMGATLMADLVRLLPSPISLALFGPTTNTGAFKFRQIMEYNNPDMGLGFSLPAAGYLDFGLFGLIGVMALCGWFIALLWRKFDPYRADAISLSYLLFAANFPISLRSDLLGLFKGFLYPFLVMWIIIQVADLGQRRDRITSSSRNFAEPQIQPRRKLASTSKKDLQRTLCPQSDPRLRWRLDATGAGVVSPREQQWDHEARDDDELGLVALAARETPSDAGKARVT